MRFKSKHRLPNLMEKLESVQYSAALAITATWKGISGEAVHRSRLGIIKFPKME